MGYEMTNQIVETVNKKSVHSMQDLISAFDDEEKENDKDAALSESTSLGKTSALIKNPKLCESKTSMDQEESFVGKREGKKDNLTISKPKEYSIEFYGDNLITLISSDLRADAENIAKKYDITDTKFIQDLQV